MNTKGYFVGRMPLKASREFQVATNVLHVWTPDFPAGAGAISCAGWTTTAGLRSGTVGGDPTCTQESGQSPQLSDACFQEDEDTMTEADHTDGRDGVVVSLVLLGATFVAGGFAGFLLALLLR